MTAAAALDARLAEGTTTLARAWEVRRGDGVRLGFTDHDRDLVFDGVTFRAETGLTARALEQGTGLSVDNSEAMGALSDAGISEADIAAGRYDGAEVLAWLVDWQMPEARKLLFRGHIGEIRRGEAAFHAELRGLGEALNRPVGRGYQAPCAAVLGDERCRAVLSVPGYVYEGAVATVRERRFLHLGPLGGFDPGFFQRGRLLMTSGAAAGLSGSVKRDALEDGRRVLELWVPFRAEVAEGDTLRVEAGCDKRFETCRLKFDNAANFQGFPDIPGEDWMTVHPTQAKAQGGGSRR